MTDDVKEYFLEKYKKANFRVVPGHWPEFETKEQVDKWINRMEKLLSHAFENAFKQTSHSKDLYPLCKGKGEDECKRGYDWAIRE